jgi:CMP/dCMP kinase
MAEVGQPDSPMRAVTISREYGSGGGEIAVRLAQRLGWRLVDHEVTVRVARELGVTVTEAEDHDERLEGFVTLLLNNMQWIDWMGLAQYDTITPPALPDEGSYQAALHRVVAAAASEGQVVIVGRGSQVLLRGRREVLHARVVAPLSQRVAYVARREGFTLEAAKERVALKDHDRVRYLRSAYRCDPADAHHYDLVINTAVLALDDAVELIARTLECKAQRLLVPEAELGPAGGLERYSGQPGDFRPPADAATPAAQGS